MFRPNSGRIQGNVNIARRTAELLPPHLKTPPPHFRCCCRTKIQALHWDQRGSTLSCLTYISKYKQTKRLYQQSCRRTRNFYRRTKNTAAALIMLSPHCAAQIHFYTNLMSVFPLHMVLYSRLTLIELYSCRNFNE